MRILKEKTLKGYKAFNKDLTCRDMQYEIGKEYEFDGEPIPCGQGFHFCTTIADTYKFYPMEDDTRICEVEAFGVVVTDDNVKFCTNKIRIIAEVTEEYLRKANANKSSSGFCNSGDYNSGDYNSGNRNSGDYNSGYHNSGDYNSGDYNSGYRNSGDLNSGDWNSGDLNSGDWNATNHSSGVFNTKEEKITMFNKKSDWTFEDWSRSEARSILMTMPIPYATTEFVVDYEMTKKEKAEHPEYTAIGGYLKVVYKDENKQEWWDNLSEANKEKVMSLPNFDKDIFKECTGITIL